MQNLSNAFCDGYCVYKLPCGYCERTGKRCFQEATVTWGVGTGTPYLKDDSSTCTAKQNPGSITEAWNGTADAGYSDA